MGNLEVNPCQSLKECYFLLDQKIRSLTLEEFVRLLLNDNNDVAWLNTWELICFTVEHILLVVGCTFVNLCFYYFFLLNDLFAIAGFAFVFLVNNFSFATAIVARS